MSFENYNDWINEIIKEHVLSSKKSFIENFNKIAIEIYYQIPPKKGFIEFINRIHNLEIILLIVSREESSLIEKWLNYFKITSISNILNNTCEERSKYEYYKNIAEKKLCLTNEIIVIDDSLKHCISAKKAGAFVIGINDNHLTERQNKMKSICDLYLNDFTTLT